MYIPKLNALTDAELIAEVIDKNSFGTLITNGSKGLQALHLPFDYDAGHQVLRCHMARANSQWRDFGSDEALVIFQGTHGYISPRWYEPAPAVPTWNYLAVHVYGTPEILTDEAEVEKLLNDLVARHERQFPQAWKLEAPVDWLTQMRAAIVAFEIPVARIEAKAKMSQNRSQADIQGVVDGLEARGSNELASWMRRLNGIK